MYSKALEKKYKNNKNFRKFESKVIFSVVDPIYFDLDPDPKKNLNILLKSIIFFLFISLLFICIKTESNLLRKNMIFL